MAYLSPRLPSPRKDHLVGCCHPGHELAVLSRSGGGWSLPGSVDIYYQLVGGDLGGPKQKIKSVLPLVYLFAS